MPTESPVVGVTMGDPGGIGPEIAVEAAEVADTDAAVVVLGDADVLREAVSITGVDLEVNPVEAIANARTEAGVLDVLDFDNVDRVDHGAVLAEYGAASLEYVERAIDLALEGSIDAMANAPIHKGAMMQAGSDHAGHTSLLVERTGVDEHTTFLVADEFVVSQVTMHVPLVEACRSITTGRVLETIRLTDDGLGSFDLADPTIAVAGLNPHAGEGGVLGSVDAEEIEPAVEAAREEGIDAHGPLSADSVFNTALDGEFDAVVAMYHDQGHIPAFMLGRVEGGGVGTAHMTVGLPFVRTSTLHGTGHDIAGEGVATPAAMIAAVETAARASR